MTRSLVATALYLLAVCSSTATAKDQQQRRGLRGGNQEQRELQTYVPTLLDDPDDATTAPGDKASSAPTEVATLMATEVPEVMTKATTAPSDKATEEEITVVELPATTTAPTEAEEDDDKDKDKDKDKKEKDEKEETRAITPEEEQMESDPNVQANDLGDGITFAIDSFLEIKFFKGAGFLPDSETEEVFFDMVRALYTNAIWESELGNDFLRYKTENIVGQYDETNNKLTYTFTSKVDMDPKTDENPRTVAYAMGSANFKEYITSLFAHNIAGIKHVDFKNVGTGYRL